MSIVVDSCSIFVIPIVSVYSNCLVISLLTLLRKTVLVSAISLLRRLSTTLAILNV